jgi:hypothetical protein
VPAIPVLIKFEQIELDWKSNFFGLKYLFKQKVCPAHRSKPLPNRLNMMPLACKSFAMRIFLFYFVAKKGKYHRFRK